MQNPDGKKDIRRKVICVFCGSSHGADPAFADAARRLGRLIAMNKCELVFGGGNIGLMNELALAARNGGGAVTSVIPDFLHRRLATSRYATHEIVTASMHERKARMYELSDAFIALPGGIGTMEELIEILTWAQLELHAKPIILINVSGYWLELLKMLERIIETGFATKSILAPLHVVSSSEEAMRALHLFRNETVDTVYPQK
jgi:uncharacterized protein (TIGR00730 family)